LLVVAESGYGKRTPLDRYPVKGRYTGGIRTIADRYEETGPIVAARVVRPDDEITLITANGIALRTSVESIRVAGRSTLGVRVISLDDGDKLASLAVLQASPIEVAPEVAVDDATDEGAIDEAVENDEVADVDEAEIDNGEELTSEVESMAEGINGTS
jgi:DNA gyrase subunit A